MKFILLSMLISLGLSTTNTNSIATDGSDENLYLDGNSSTTSDLSMEEAHPCLSGCIETTVRTYCGVVVTFQAYPCPWFPPFQIQRARLIRQACGVGGVDP